MWDTRSPRHPGAQPVAGLALAGVQLGVCSATPLVPTEMPTSPWLPTDIPAGKQPARHQLPSRSTAGCYTPGNVARAAPPGRAGSAQGAESLALLAT